MSEVLKVVAAELDALMRSRGYIAELIRCREPRPACQPEDPQFAREIQLLGRLEACCVRLADEQMQLMERRFELLRKARTKSPFSCPTDLQARIVNYETIQSYVDSRNAHGLLQLYCQFRDGLLEQVLPFLQKLAYPNAQFWHSKPNRNSRSPVDDWKVVSDCIQAALQSFYAERQRMEERHGEILETEVEGLLELPAAVIDAGRLAAEVSVVREREAARVNAIRDHEATALEAVQRVWRGTQEVIRWANRQAVEVGENDRSLASNWARSHGGDSYWIDAMESARFAELVALALYRDLYGRAEDLSMLQLVSPSDCRWQRADVATGGRWVDVKNARCSFSSPKIYSEHTVKRFKSDRIGEDVAISGFLSPYLAHGGFSPPEPVIWLGETTLRAVERLRRDFETDYLKIDLSRDRLTLIPPWLFEYPAECYTERDSALRAVRSDGFVLPKSDCPLGLLVLAGRATSAASRDTLSGEAVMLSRRLRASATPTRPILFLHILDRFCHTARNRVPFPAAALPQTLFSADSPALSQCANNMTPLAVFDPLEVVKTLLDVLEKVAATCGQRAASFTSFRLAGPGIFRGRRDLGDWQTLFAYCGGWRKRRTGEPVKCGQNPLYLGQNNPCDVCRKLICHQCGFCTHSCVACNSRQTEWPTP